MNTTRPVTGAASVSWPKITPGVTGNTPTYPLLPGSRVTTISYEDATKGLPLGNSKAQSGIASPMLYVDGDISYPLSANGTRVPISIKGFSFEGWKKISHRVSEQVRAGLDPDSHGDITVKYMVPELRWKICEAALYVTADSFGQPNNIVIQLSTRVTLGYSRFQDQNGLS